MPLRRGGVHTINLRDYLITRYTGAEGEHAPLHKLGSSQWQKAQARAAQRIRDVAAELLDVYAKRRARTGHVDEDAYQSFAQGFRGNARSSRGHRRGARRSVIPTG